MSKSKPTATQWNRRKSISLSSGLDNFLVQYNNPTIYMDIHRGCSTMTKSFPEPEIYFPDPRPHSTGHRNISASAWDLTSTEREKRKRKKEKHTLSKAMISLINLGDPAVSGDNLHLRSLIEKAGTFPNGTGSDESSPTEFRGPTDDLDKGMDREPVANGISNGHSHRAPPDLPKGKTVTDVVFEAKKADRLFKLMFQNEVFWAIIGRMNYDEFRNFTATTWSRNPETGLVERELDWTLSKSIPISISKATVHSKQSQVQASYCRKGRIYGVDTVATSSGVIYADSFKINIHYRILKESSSSCRLIIVADIQFLKSVFIRSKIESETWHGIKKYYESMCKFINNEDVEKAIADEEAKLNHTPVAVETGKDVPDKRVLNQAVTTTTTPAPPSGGVINDQVVIVAFVIISLILLLMTWAMFKLGNAVLSLSDRMENIERLLGEVAQNLNHHDTDL